MKKTYIEPKIQEIRLNISNIICGSNLGIANETTTGAGITEGDSRRYDRHNMWDDEDWDDEDF